MTTEQVLIINEQKRKYKVQMPIRLVKREYCRSNYYSDLILYRDAPATWGQGNQTLSRVEETVAEDYDTYEGDWDFNEQTILDDRNYEGSRNMFGLFCYSTMQMLVGPTGKTVLFNTPEEAFKDVDCSMEDFNADYFILEIQNVSPTERTEHSGTGAVPAQGFAGELAKKAVKQGWHTT